MVGALTKSGISGAVLTGLYVWAFGMPWTWGVFVFWSFISLVVIILVSVFLAALKWAIIMKILFSDY